MLLSILHLLCVLADKSNKKAAKNTSSVTTPGTSVSTTIANIAPGGKDAIASTSVAKSTSVVAQLDDKEICVKCYNDFVTPDCTNTCSCKCDDGSKSVKAVKKPTQCPNTDPKEVPCSCKDENNNIIPENNYIKRGSVLGIGN